MFQAKPDVLANPGAPHPPLANSLRHPPRRHIEKRRRLVDGQQVSGGRDRAVRHRVSPPHPYTAATGTRADTVSKMAREWVSRRPVVRLLEAVQEKPQRGKVLVHLPDLLFAPAAYEWETAYFHKVVSVPCVVTLTQKEFGRPASSGEQTRMKTEQTRHGVPLGLDIATRS